MNYIIVILAFLMLGVVAYDDLDRSSREEVKATVINSANKLSAYSSKKEKVEILVLEKICASLSKKNTEYCVRFGDIHIFDEKINSLGISVLLGEYKGAYEAGNIQLMFKTELDVVLDELMIKIICIGDNKENLIYLEGDKNRACPI